MIILAILWLLMPQASTLTLSPVHSWYPDQCCGEVDCRPANCEELKYDGEYIHYRGMQIERWRAQASSDGGCHVCIHNGGLLCVFIGGQS
jgi:hypothetical protein